MKVRLTQLVDIDDVPDKLVDMLDKINKKITNMPDVIKAAIVLLRTDEESSPYLETVIDNLRKDLASVDGELAEVANIFAGLNSLPEQPDLPLAQEPTEVE